MKNLTCFALSALAINLVGCGDNLEPDDQDTDDPEGAHVPNLFLDYEFDLRDRAS